MSCRRWIKFWPQDWQRDPALRACSLAARGLWMELLCIAHESEPYGHVTLNGRAMTEAEVASIVGRPRREILPLIAELERAGVFSRTAEGVIYSRRLVRDADLSAIGRDHAEKRWNQRVGTPDPNGLPNGPASPAPMRQEARSQNPEASVPGERHGEAVPAEGARGDFWNEGLATFRRLTGRPAAPSRAFLGRMLRDLSDDCAVGLALLREAEALRPGDPTAWLSAAVQARRGGRESPWSHAAQMRRVVEVFGFLPDETGGDSAPSLR